MPPPSKDSLSRRTLLRSEAGATLVTPWLYSIAAKCPRTHKSDNRSRGKNSFRALTRRCSSVGGTSTKLTPGTEVVFIAILRQTLTASPKRSVSTTMWSMALVRTTDR